MREMIFIWRVFRPRCTMHNVYMRQKLAHGVVINIYAILFNIFICSHYNNVDGAGTETETYTECEWVEMDMVFGVPFRTHNTTQHNTRAWHGEHCGWSHHTLFAQRVCRLMANKIKTCRDPRHSLANIRIFCRGKIPVQSVKYANLLLNPTS